MSVEGEGSCKVKTTNLNDELGQIEYIFSDKTGTLTQNIMLFRSCGIGSELYDDDFIDKKREDDKNNTLGDFDNNNSILHYFSICIGLCHEVSPDKKEDGKITYRSESPDEFALMEACHYLRYDLINRTENTITLSHNDKLLTFKVHALLQFNSDRKRLTVIVEDMENNEYWLFSKVFYFYYY